MTSGTAATQVVQLQMSPQIGVMVAFLILRSFASVKGSQILADGFELVSCCAGANSSHEDLTKLREAAFGILRSPIGEAVIDSDPEIKSVLTALGFVARMENSLGI